MTERHLKLAFMDTGTADAVSFGRMKNFTQFSISKNPKTYNRKYVDMKSETEHVSSYHPSISYKFDRDVSDKVLEKIVNVTDLELTGDASVVTILLVDLDKESETKAGSFEAVTRTYSIVPSTEGDDSEIYTYAGSFTTVGEPVYGTATTVDGWATATFTENAES